MFRMNGMPRAQGCAGAACVKLAQWGAGMGIAYQDTPQVRICTPLTLQHWFAS